MRILLKKIAPLNYVVQRGWEGFPDKVGEDLDLFVAEEHYGFLCQAIPENFPVKVDIRTQGDGYYPPEIEEMLLTRHRVYKGAKIPSQQAYFISLFYHAHVHGREKKYRGELKSAFLDWIPPVKPDDEGVVYNP